MLGRTLGSSACCCLLAALGSAHFLGVAPEREEIRFSAIEGERLRKTFSSRLEMVTQRDDSIVDLGRWHTTRRVEVVDEYGPSVGGVPRFIHRTVDSAQGSHEHSWEIPAPFGSTLSGDVERGAVSPFLARTVRLELDSTGLEPGLAPHDVIYQRSLLGEPDVSPDAEGGLALLPAALDLTGFLPNREVAVGDKWFRSAAPLGGILWPVGAMDWSEASGGWAKGPPVEQLAIGLDAQLGQAIAGTVRVDLLSIEEDRGTRFALLGLRGTLDAQDSIEVAWSSHLTDTQELSLSGQVSLDLMGRVEGRAWWNCDAGHLDSLELSVELTLHQGFDDVEWAWSAGDKLDWWEEHFGEWVDGLLPTGRRTWVGTLSSQVDFLPLVESSSGD